MNVCLIKTDGFEFLGGFVGGGRMEAKFWNSSLISNNIVFDLRKRMVLSVSRNSYWFTSYCWLKLDFSWKIRFSKQWKTIKTVAKCNSRQLNYIVIPALSIAKNRKYHIWLQTEVVVVQSQHVSDVRFIGVKIVSSTCWL